MKLWDASFKCVGMSETNMNSVAWGLSMGMSVAAPISGTTIAIVAMLVEGPQTQKHLR